MKISSEKIYFNLLDFKVLSYTPIKPPSSVFHAFLYHIDTRLDELDNNLLLAHFQIEEFRRDLFQMHIDKSPDPDGFNISFYKIFWDVIRLDIFKAASQWSPLLNNTNIVLIPKKDNPIYMLHLRSISLCNVLYKNNLKY